MDKVQESFRGENADRFVVCVCLGISVFGYIIYDIVEIRFSNVNFVWNDVLMICGRRWLL